MAGDDATAKLNLDVEQALAAYLRNQRAYEASIAKMEDATREFGKVSEAEFSKLADRSESALLKMQASAVRLEQANRRLGAENERLAATSRLAAESAAKLALNEALAANAALDAARKEAVASDARRASGELANRTTVARRIATDSAAEAADRAKIAEERYAQSVRSLQQAAALGAAGLIKLAVDSLDANIALNKLQVTLKATEGSATAGGQAYGFVRSEVNRLNIPLIQAAEGFTRLSAAAKGTSLQGAGVRDVFSAFSETFRVLQLNSQQSELAFYALQQMLSKGSVASEELKRQLGDQIPGAMQIAARAAGATVDELESMLRTGTLLSADFLPKFAAELRKTFGSGLEDAINGRAAQIERLKNKFIEFKASFAEGFAAEAITGATQLGDQLSQDAATADGLGRGLGALINALAGAANALVSAGRAAAGMYADLTGLSDGVRSSTDDVLAYSAAQKELQRVLGESKPSADALAAGLGYLSDSYSALQEAGRLTTADQENLVRQADELAAAYKRAGVTVPPVLAALSERLHGVAQAASDIAPAADNATERLLKMGSVSAQLSKSQEELRVTLFGSRDELTKQLRELEGVAYEEGHTAEQTTILKDQIQKLLDAYIKFGEVPNELQELADHFGVVSSASEDAAKKAEKLAESQEKAALSAKKLGDQQEATAAQITQAAEAAGLLGQKYASQNGDLFGGGKGADQIQKNVEQLKKRKVALEAEQESSGLSLDKNEELAQVTADLSAAEFDLQAAQKKTVQQTNAVTNASGAALDVTKELTDAEVNRIDKIVGGLLPALGKVADETERSRASTEGAAGDIEKLGDAADSSAARVGVAGDQMSQAAIAAGGFSDALDGLRTRQDENNAAAESVAESYQKTTAATTALGDETATTDEKITALKKELADVKDLLTSAFGDEMKAIVRAFADSISTDLLPVCRELRDCLEAASK